MKIIDVLHFICLSLKDFLECLFHREKEMALKHQKSINQSYMVAKEQLKKRL
jgi:hypothetical protein